MINFRNFFKNSVKISSKFFSKNHRKFAKITKTTKILHKSFEKILAKIFKKF